MEIYVINTYRLHAQISSESLRTWGLSTSTRITPPVNLLTVSLHRSVELLIFKSLYVHGYFGSYVGLPSICTRTQVFTLVISRLVFSWPRGWEGPVRCLMIISHSTFCQSMSSQVSISAHLWPDQRMCTIVWSNRTITSVLIYIVGAGKHCMQLLVTDASWWPGA